MKLTWMGNSRELIRSLIYYANMTTRNLSATFPPALGVELTKCEYQVLEYVVEFEDERRIMTDIANGLGLIQSVVTRSAKHLVSMGLVEKYRMSGNRKNIVLRPTERGREVYLEIKNLYVEPVFAQFLSYMESLPPERAAEFTEAINALNAPWLKFISRERQELEIIED